jgi:hypothetical protein
VVGAKGEDDTHFETVFFEWRYKFEAAEMLQERLRSQGRERELDSSRD